MTSLTFKHLQKVSAKFCAHEYSPTSHEQMSPKVNSKLFVFVKLGMLISYIRHNVLFLFLNLMTKLLNTS